MGEDVSCCVWLKPHLKCLQQQGRGWLLGLEEWRLWRWGCPVALDWQPHPPLALWLDFTLSWEEVESRPRPPPLQPDLSFHFSGPFRGHAHSCTITNQDGESPGDTHTTSSTTEASSQSWVWGQPLPKPMGHSGGKRNWINLWFSVNEERIHAGEAAYKMPKRPLNASVRIKPGCSAGDDAHLERE